LRKKLGFRNLIKIQIFNNAAQPHHQKSISYFMAITDGNEPRIILKALRSNAFKIILGSSSSAKRCNTNSQAL